MAVRTVHVRSGGGRTGLCLCLLLAACSEGELTTVPRPDTAVPRRLVGVPTVVDADTLVVAGRTVQLWGLHAPARSARCPRADGTSWPCGEHAAAALAGWLGPRSVNCDPRGRPAGDTVVALCRVGGRDLGNWLVLYGWAHDSPTQSGGLYRTFERAAASKRRGLWGEPPPETATP